MSFRTKKPGFKFFLLLLLLFLSYLVTMLYPKKTVPLDELQGALPVPVRTIAS